MLTDRLRDRHEDHAGLFQFFLEGRRHRNGVEHRVDGNTRARTIAALYPGQDLLFAQRNSQLFVSAENLGVDLVERFQRRLLRRRVIVDVLIIDFRIVHACPGRLAHRQPAAIGFQPPGQHPLRLVFLARDESDRVFRQALWGLFGFDLGLEPILVLINVDTADLFDGLLYGRHSSLRSRLQGPRVGFVGYGARAIVRRWFPWVDDVRLTPWPPVQAATPLLSLSSDPATVFQVSAKRSISASVVPCPILARMAPRARAASTPMAARTSEG